MVRLPTTGNVTVVLLRLWTPENKESPVTVKLLAIPVIDLVEVVPVTPVNRVNSLND
jgi:hypothetical protein